MTKTRKASKSSLREVVGDDIYEVWVEMLKRLVPSGRTHRLSVVVASMLTHAVQCASEAEQDSPSDRLLEAAEADIEEAPRLLKPMLVQLFRDAKVKHERISSKGERYSILEQAVVEFCCWYNYPWDY